MITLQKVGDALKFTFTDNPLYLQNGTIEVPVNSLTLVTDNSGIATFKKSASNDIFVCASYDELGMTKAELETWFKNNAVGGGGGMPSGDIQTMIDQSISGMADNASYDSVSQEIKFYNGNTEVYSVDASDFVIDGMIDDVRIETISGVTYLVIDFNTASGKEDIQIPLTDIFDPSNYYTKTEVDQALSGKQDTLIEGVGINIDDNIISVENPTVYLTQAEYDALVQGGTVDPDTYYVISDATAIDINQYYTSAQTESAITAAVSGKVDSSSVVTAITSGSTDSEIPTAKAVYDAIPQGGGGKAISAGTNISVTTGETADTVSCTLPISASAVVSSSDPLLFGTNINGIYYNSIGIGKRISGSSNNSVVIATPNFTTNLYTFVNGESIVAIGRYVRVSGLTSANGDGSVAIGSNVNIKGMMSIAIGDSSSVSGNTSTALGRATYAKGDSSVAIGNSSKTSGDSSVAIGSGTTANGVDYKTNINNQIKVTPTNQVYIYNKDNTEMICLQDNLGSTIEVSSAITSGDTNPVEGGVLYDELRVTDENVTVLEWENNDGGNTTNYPSGGTVAKLEFIVDESQMTDGGFVFVSDIEQDDVGYINISSTGGTVTVTDSSAVTYSISGNVVTVTYPTIAPLVSYLSSYYDCYWTVNAIDETVVPLKDKVVALDGVNDRLSEDEEVTARALIDLNDKFDGLKLQQISQADYDALSPNYDNNTLYVII